MLLSHDALPPLEAVCHVQPRAEASSVREGGTKTRYRVIGCRVSAEKTFLPPTSMSAQTSAELQPLWTQLLPLPTIKSLGPRSSAASVPAPPSLLPSDKASTTLRLLLQDTQCSLEKFSTRLDTLFLGLEQSTQSISRAGSLLEDSRDAVASDVRTIGQSRVYGLYMRPNHIPRVVTSLREDIQSVLGTPAQAQTVLSLRDSFSATLDAH